MTPSFTEGVSVFGAAQPDAMGGGKTRCCRGKNEPHNRRGRVDIERGPLSVQLGFSAIASLRFPFDAEAKQEDTRPARRTAFRIRGEPGRE
jgi:hypothetical protein